MVLASSSAVYGDDPELPKRETMAFGPLSPYAVQKMTGEYYAGLYTKLYGLETACLRYFNVFGPRQDPSSPYSGVISIFLDRAAAGRAPVIFGNGEQTRDFVYVRDVVSANLRAATEDTAAGKAFNIGTGKTITINRLWQQVAELVVDRTNLWYSKAIEITRRSVGEEWSRPSTLPMAIYQSRPGSPSNHCRSAQSAV